MSRWKEKIQNKRTKKLLTVDDTTNNYLVYCPLSYEKPEDNWLLDIEMYSEEFRADLISIWMEKLSIPSTPAMRKQVKEYRDQLFEIAKTVEDEWKLPQPEQLRRETQADVKLQDVQGIFPTITKFGMAALLPHEELEVELHGDVLKIMVDGVSTDSGYRDKILKSVKPNSAAIKYHDLVSAKRADRNAMVKGMDVVYIYHDTIDEASHTADSRVFPAKLLSEGTGGRQP